MMSHREYAQARHDSYSRILRQRMGILELDPDRSAPRWVSLRPKTAWYEFGEP